MKKKGMKFFCFLGCIVLAMMFAGCPPDKEEPDDPSTDPSIVLDVESWTLYLIGGEAGRQVKVTAMVLPQILQPGVSWSILSGNNCVELREESNASVIIYALAVGSAVVKATAIHAVDDNGQPITANVNITIEGEKPARPITWTFPSSRAPEDWPAGESGLNGEFGSDAYFEDGLWLLTSSGNRNYGNEDLDVYERDPIQFDYDNGLSNGSWMHFTSATGMGQFLRLKDGSGTWGRIEGLKGPFTLSISYGGGGSTPGQRRPMVKIFPQNYPQSPALTYNYDASLSFVQEYAVGELVVIYEGEDYPEVLLKYGTIGIRIFNMKYTPGVEGFVEEVNLNLTSRTMGTGHTFKLEATVSPYYANQQVTWTSSNTSIATVSADGTVTGVSAGDVIITATTVGTTEAGGPRTAECAVKVIAGLVLVESVSLKSETTLQLGGTETLTATVNPANATEKGVIWSTSNRAIADVENGVVTTYATGTAIITATSVGLTQEDVPAFAECVVTVFTAERRTLMWDFDYTGANFPIPGGSHAIVNPLFNAAKSSTIDFGNGFTFYDPRSTLESGNQGRPSLDAKYQRYIDEGLFTPGPVRLDTRTANGDRWGTITGVQGPYKILIVYTATGTTNLRAPRIKIKDVLYNETGDLSTTAYTISGATFPEYPAETSFPAVNPNVLEVVYEGTDSPDIILAHCDYNNVPGNGGIQIRVFNIVIEPIN